MSKPFLTAEQVVDRSARLFAAIKDCAPHVSDEDALFISLRMATMDMDEFDMAWERRKNDLPEWVSLVEGRIIGKLLDTALGLESVFVLVRDEEGHEPIKPTRDRAAIEKEIAATGMTGLNFQTELGRHLGWVLLVHGNENDVISDYTDNPWTDTLVKPAIELSESLQ